MIYIACESDADGTWWHIVAAISYRIIQPHSTEMQDD